METEVKNTELSEVEPDYTEQVSVYGARVHNLKNIDIDIPRNKLTVITGLSGSGKSSLAFDTIYAEGQRRYIETFSAYARQFLGGLERPDVDKITGLSPVIAIEQKTTNRNPRSTVGTVTEIYDFLRLLYARVGEAFSYLSGERMVKYTDEQIIHLILEKFSGKKIYILAPIVKSRKGHYKELFEQIRKKGFLYVRVDGEVKEIKHGLKVDRYKTHNIEIVIDKTVVPIVEHQGNLFDDILAKAVAENQNLSDEIKRLKASVQTAMKHGKGIISILDKETNDVRYFSRQLMCPVTGISYDEPAPNNFSFNSPEGACPRCNGLGVISQVDKSKVFPDTSLTIYQGGIAPIGKHSNTLIFWQIEAILKKHDISIKTPIKDIPDEILELILFGSDEVLKLDNTPLGSFSNYFLNFNGVLHYINEKNNENSSEKVNNWTEQFIKTIQCPECHGGRLKKESLHFKIGGKNISELSGMGIDHLQEWLLNVDDKLSNKQKTIAKEINKEIVGRLGFLIDVGLTYLTLNRPAQTLSGGESQRIRLATQIGSQLVNVLYILDEPSIGLHQRDNHRLIQSLQKLRDNNNSIIVVEHDKDMILSADYVVDLGPMAGKHGGEIVAKGTPAEILKSDTLTAHYLNKQKEIEIPKIRRAGNGLHLIIKGTKGNNLKNITVDFPLGKLICITGVSGSGKTTLINDTLYPILSQKFYRSLTDPLDYDSIEGLEHIDKVIDVDQSPIGRTPRSNPATYTEVFTDIRKLFEKLPESQIRGYKLGRFSFNVKGGRCETCRGAGVKTIEMNLLPDVYVECEECNGRRYNRETLEVRYRGKSVSDILDMTIDQAVEFFENIPHIQHKIKVLHEVGLGYITLGQPSTTLSGGESQRVKLATELSKRSTGKTLYILDEPTTGLHFEDIRVLLDVLNKLVDKGNTIIVIEHNLDVIKVADHIIDLGPEGGEGGGQILCTGTPEEIIKKKSSHTAHYLKLEMK